MLGANGQAIWTRCAAALGHPEWYDDPRFAMNQARLENRAALEAEILARFGLGEADLATLRAKGVV